jgi:hypothetical protein
MPSKVVNRRKHRVGGEGEGEGDGVQQRVEPATEQGQSPAEPAPAPAQQPLPLPQGEQNLNASNELILNDTDAIDVKLGKIAEYLKTSDNKLTQEQIDKVSEIITEALELRLAFHDAENPTSGGGKSKGKKATPIKKKVAKK